MDEKVKCIVCDTRLVLQREWKKEFEKNRCATCIAFLRYVFQLEKALRENMRAIGITDKELFIDIYRPNMTEKMAESLGLVPENKIDKKL